MHGDSESQSQHNKHHLCDYLTACGDIFGLISGCKLHVKKLDFGENGVSEVFVLADVCAAVYRTVPVICVDAHVFIIIIIVVIVPIVDGPLVFEVYCSSTMLYYTMLY